MKKIELVFRHEEVFKMIVEGENAEDAASNAQEIISGGKEGKFGYTYESTGFKILSAKEVVS